MLVFAIERLLLQIERCGSHFYISYLAGDEGFEPPNAWTKTRCLTTWRIPIMSAYGVLRFVRRLFSGRKNGVRSIAQDRPDKPGSVHSHLTVANVAAIYLSVRLPPSPAAAV